MLCALTSCTVRYAPDAPETTLAGMPETATHRPLGVVVAAAGTTLVALLLIGLAVASMASGHGSFSGGVALALLGYSAAMLGSAWALWRLSLFGRGPVVATAALNGVAGYTFSPSAPWVWLVVAVSAVTLVAAALPSTSRALHLRRRRDTEVTPGDAPQRTDDPGT